MHSAFGQVQAKLLGKVGARAWCNCDVHGSRAGRLAQHGYKRQRDEPPNPGAIGFWLGFWLRGHDYHWFGLFDYFGSIELGAAPNAVSSRERIVFTTFVARASANSAAPTGTGKTA